MVMRLSPEFEQPGYKVTSVIVGIIFLIISILVGFTIGINIVDNQRNILEFIVTEGSECTFQCFLDGFVQPDHENIQIGIFHQHESFLRIPAGRVDDQVIVHLAGLSTNSAVRSN
jgi:hypothetical protein